VHIVRPSRVGAPLAVEVRKDADWRIRGSGKLTCCKYCREELFSIRWPAAGQGDQILDSLQGELDVRRFLKRILRSPDQQAASMTLDLVRAGEAGVDEAIFNSLQHELSFYKVRSLAIRILVERNRDRDPNPLLNLVPDGHIRADRSTGAIKGAVKAPIVTRYEFGFGRLRRLDPIGQYDTILQCYPAPVRMNAAIGLGDSGEVGSLNSLMKALKDNDYHVRAFGADAIRRLGNAGLRDDVLAHPARELLVELLRDPFRNARIASARALGSLGDSEPLTEFNPHSSRDRSEWARILQGKIPPLKRIWPGDLTI